jgi:hypothetical protein
MDADCSGENRWTISGIARVSADAALERIGHAIAITVRKKR